MSNATPAGVISVRINPGKASARTRKRVKSCGPDFEYFENVNRPNAVLLRSTQTGWFGWIPADEIEWSYQTKEKEQAK